MLKIKFFTVLVMHLFLFLGFLLFANLLPDQLLNSANYPLYGGFSALYFILVWKDLYSKPYHHYLKNAFSYIFRDLLICAATLVIAKSLYFIIFNISPIRISILGELSLIVFYFITHIIQYVWIVHLASLGFFRKNVILVGTFDDRIPVEELFQNINNTKNFLGQLTLSKGVWEYRPDFQSTGKPLRKDLSNFLFSKTVNELIICMDDNLSGEALEQCAAWCRENSIGYYLIPDISRLPRSSFWSGRFKTIPSLERYCPNRDSLIMVSLKRLLDIFVSSAALAILAPLFVLIALLIYSEDGGPVFYVSKRVGIHGRRINFVKFRSMVKNAERLKDDLLSLNERPDGPLFKLTKDPRVTRIGRILRATSLDEFPQFWNVLRGDMSLIGPRPHLPCEVAEYSDRDNLRLECIPGISCLPQINGRNTLGFREWVDLDLEYRKKWSIGFDFTILAKTAKMVLVSKAY